MRRDTITALVELNRRFYTACAGEFGRTRRAPWPGWERVLEAVREAVSDPPPWRVLDVGCGNGRFLRYLREHPDCEFSYTGVDFSAELLRECAQVGNARLLELDLAAEPAPWPVRGDFHWIVAFGTLHHVPGFARRRRLVEELVALLAAGGVVVLSHWNFLLSARQRRKVVPWERLPAELEVEAEDLEEGDALLSFGGVAGLRYCHFASEEERAALLAGVPVRCLTRFTADGREGDLNEYVVLQRDRPSARGETARSDAQRSWVLPGSRGARPARASGGNGGVA